LEKSPWAVFSAAGPARLRLSPIQRVKPAHAVCFLRTLPSGPRHLSDPTCQPHSFAGENCYTPDPLRRPVPSQTCPLSSAPAVLRSPAQFRSTGRPRAVPQRCPAESPLLRRLAPSRTETSPRTTARMCHCRTRIVVMPSKLHLSAWGRRLTDKPGTRQGAHAPPRLSLASCRVASHR
jgi:hypothetical protein